MITNIEYVSKMLPEFDDYIHKGHRGRVLIIGGSTGLTGAVCMCANAALKSGAGLITAAVPRSLNNIFEIKLTEVMTCPVDDKDGDITVNSVRQILTVADKCDAVAIGPGAGVGNGVRAVLEELCMTAKKMIIDADAINVLAINPDILKKSKADVLLTPHIGEMSRLCGNSCEEISNKRTEYAVSFANEYNVNILLKGKNTVITNGKDVFVNPTGNNGMAKGGSGDVLTGICVALAAQGLPTFESGIAGAYIHGLAGDIAKEKFTDFSMTPCDIIDNLGIAFKKITEI